MEEKIKSPEFRELVKLRECLVKDRADEGGQMGRPSSCIQEY